MGGHWTGGRRIGPESIDRSGGSEEPVYVGIGVKQASPKGFYRLNIVDLSSYARTCNGVERGSLDYRAINGIGG